MTNKYKLKLPEGYIDCLDSDDERSLKKGCECIAWFDGDGLQAFDVKSEHLTALAIWLQRRTQ